MNLQKHFIAGRFTKPHDLLYTPKGTAVLINSVAVNYKPKEGAERVTFYNVKAWGSTAENLSNYTDKGAPIYLECSMENESWEKDGVKHYRDVFVVQRFQLLESQEEAMRRAEKRG